MEEFIKEKQEFKIIPENFEGATIGIVERNDKESFCIKLLKADMKNYVAGEEVELFSFVKKGILYFKTKIEIVEGESLLLEHPSSHQILQRRQYSRVPFNKEVMIKKLSEKDFSGGEIKAFALDISAGGMKLTSDVPLEVSKDYEIGIEIYNTVVECIFQPIRTEEANNEMLLKYTVSGRFKNIESIDRITLVQFCFKTQMEADSVKNK